MVQIPITTTITTTTNKIIIIITITIKRMEINPAINITTALTEAEARAQTSSIEKKMSVEEELERCAQESLIDQISREEEELELEEKEFASDEAGDCDAAQKVVYTGGVNRNNENAFDCADDNLSRSIQREVGRWPVEDDFLMIKLIENGAALEVLTKAGAFTKKYELKDIERRWEKILYDDRVALEAGKRVREFEQRKKSEDEVNAFVSERVRKGDCFETMWKKKKTASRNNDYDNNNNNNNNNSNNSNRRNNAGAEDYGNDGNNNGEMINQVNMFKDAEMFILKECEPLPTEEEMDEAVEKREKKRKERTIHEIAKLEKDLTTVASRAMTRSGIIAKIIGQNTMFTLTKRESTVGRSTTDSAVDVDLSKEGNASKISRVQAYLKLRWNGEFTLRNVGKRPIWINNKPIETNNRARLHSHALIEVGGMRMLFVPNPSLVRCIKPEEWK